MRGGRNDDVLDGHFDIKIRYSIRRRLGCGPTLAKEVAPLAFEAILGRTIQIFSIFVDDGGDFGGVARINQFKVGGKGLLRFHFEDVFVGFGGEDAILLGQYRPPEDPEKGGEGDSDSSYHFRRRKASRGATNKLLYAYVVSKSETTQVGRSGISALSREVSWLSLGRGVSRVRSVVRHEAMGIFLIEDS